MVMMVIILSLPSSPLSPCSISSPSSSSSSGSAAMSSTFMRVSLAGCERLLLFQFLPLQNDHHSHRKDDDHDQNIMITTTMMTKSCQERYRFLSAVCPPRPSIQGNIGAAVNMNREAR